jgi:hypothetical protein
MFEKHRLTPDMHGLRVTLSYPGVYTLPGRLLRLFGGKSARPFLPPNCFLFIFQHQRLNNSQNPTYLSKWLHGAMAVIPGSGTAGKMGSKKQEYAPQVDSPIHITLK